MKRAWMVLLCGLLGTCTEPVPSPAVLTEHLAEGPLAFVCDGQTTREQVLLKLGIPSADFEGQRILTYRVFYDDKNMAVEPRDRVYPSAEAQWGGITCSLVLVFDARNILQRHSLVPMRDMIVQTAR